MGVPEEQRTSSGVACSWHGVKEWKVDTAVCISEKQIGTAMRLRL